MRSPRLNVAGPLWRTTPVTPLLLPQVVEPGAMVRDGGLGAELGGDERIEPTAEKIAVTKHGALGRADDPRKERGVDEDRLDERVRRLSRFDVHAGTASTTWKFTGSASYASAVRRSMPAASERVLSATSPAEFRAYASR